MNNNVEFKNDGYIYCPLCNGTKLGPNMNEYAELISLDILRKTDMCYCQHYGRKGKIEYVSFAMGERFIGGS